MTEQTQAQQSATAETPATQQPTGIQIADLQVILNIIDLASSRGAFRANELTNVGAIADKLGKFLSAVAEQQKQKEEQEKADNPEQTATAETPAEASTEQPAKE